MKGRMFDCITCTWNPLGGPCYHNCIYCWSMGKKGLVKKFNMKKYQGKPRLFEKEFKRKFKDDDFVFVQDMSDLFGEWVPKEYIQRVLDYINKFSNTTFLLLTKNPARYKHFIIPLNCICGATIETNRDYKMSDAPDTTNRYIELALLIHPRKTVSIEPIMDFDLDVFVNGLHYIKPEFIYIGYDNYNYNLPLPSKQKIDKLIKRLEKFTEVRKKWNIMLRNLK